MVNFLNGRLLNNFSLPANLLSARKLIFPHQTNFSSIVMMAKDIFHGILYLHSMNISIVDENLQIYQENVKFYFIKKKKQKQEQ